LVTDASVGPRQEYGFGRECGHPPPIGSEKHIKVEHEAPIVIPEERAILRISDVGVHFKSVKVIGQITKRTREPDSMFRTDLDIF
jgi:hypothetical protein